MTSAAPRSVARAYIDAVGEHDLTALEDLLDDRLSASFAGSSSDKATWIAALHRLMPALLRNDVAEIFVDGDRACVVYDFVTNTDGGTVRCVELLTVSDARITDIELILDRVAFAPVNKTLAERAAQVR